MTKSLLLKNLLYLVIATVSFVLLKFSIWPAVFLYPYCIYKLLKENSLKTATLLGFIVGCIYFYSLFLWATKTGIELSLIGGLVSGLVFGTSALFYKLIEKRVYPKYNLVSKLDLILWPLSFYIVQHTLFIWLFVDASYLLDVPPFLPYTYAFIGSGGMHFLILGLSILCGVALTTRKKLLASLSGIIIIILCLLQAHFLYADPASSEENLSVALIQVNITEEIAWKQQRADSLYELHKRKVLEAAKQGAEMIILPENAILFWSDDISKEEVMNELELISSAYDTYIVFSTLEKDLETRKIQSIAYFIDPATGVQKPYIAHRTYDYLGGENQFAVGTEDVVYQTPFGTFRILICFEALFRDELKTDDLDSYDHIIVMANNQFLPSHRGLKTLEWNAQDIAGTYNKSVLYASNNGPTLYADAYGKIHESLPYDTEDILWASMQLPNEF